MSLSFTTATHYLDLAEEGGIRWVGLLDYYTWYFRVNRRLGIVYHEEINRWIFREINNYRSAMMIYFGKAVEKIDESEEDD
jgi:hypothetical protein